MFGLTLAEGEEDTDSPWTIEQSCISESIVLHESVILKGLPKGVQDFVIKLYMDTISPTECTSVRSAGTMAVVEFQDAVGTWSESCCIEKLQYPKMRQIFASDQLAFLCGTHLPIV